MTVLAPQSLSANAQQLSITWNDGRTGVVTWRTLRDKCPCAVCRVERASPPPMLIVLGPGEMAPIRATRMEAIGNYAYRIDFSDGHSSGIFPLDLLSELTLGTP